jgi:rsbT co-antagonist protein RsbR
VATASRIPDILTKYEAELHADWLKELLSATSRRELRMKESELREQAIEFSRLFREAVQRGNVTNIEGAEWEAVRDLLTRLSRSRGFQGFNPSETATFIFSFKRPLFTALRREIANSEQLADELWTATALLDRLGLFVTEVHQKTREEVISRQQQEMMELSTPVVNLWDNVLALPLIGTLDSSRTQTVMEALLQRIADSGSEIAIIDITGVPTVDTLTAQHLLKTVTATRLMGAEAIISGIRPQIAQTIVHLGVDLSGVTTKATLAGAFQLALQRLGLTVQRIPQQQHSKK